MIIKYIRILARYFFIGHLLTTASFAHVEISDPQLWTHFSINNGLPVNRIRHLLEDQDGFLLIITVNNGIYRYDGAQFFPLEINKQLPTLFIQQVIKDQNGRLWIACNYNGIRIYDQGKLYPYKFNSHFKKQHFTAIFQDDSGNTWVNVNKVGLFRCKKDSIENITEKYDLIREDIYQICEAENSNLYILFGKAGLYHLNLLKNGHLTRVIGHIPRVTCFCKTKNGDLWLTSLKKGVIRISGSEEKLISNISCLGKGLNFFLEDKKNRIWLIINNAIYCYDKNKLYSISTANADHGQPFRDSFGNLWFPTQNGLYKYLNPESKSRTIPEPGDVKRDIFVKNDHFIYSDRQHRLWFTTGTAGNLYNFNGHSMQRFKFPDSLKHFKVTDFVQDLNGNYWMSSNGQGLLCWDGTDFSRPVPTDCLPGDYITSLCIDSGNRVWIGSLSALSHLRNPKAPQLNQPQFQIIPVLSGQNEITSLHVDARETVWIGTRQSMLFKSAGQKFIHLQPEVNDRTSLRNIRNLYFYQNKLYGTCRQGVFCYESRKRQFSFFQNPALESQFLTPPLPGKLPWYCGDFYQVNTLYLIESYKGFKQYPGTTIYNIAATYEDDKDGLWIGSCSVGLFYVSNDTLIRFGNKHGLPSFKISAIYRDQHRRLWIGTLDKGLFQYRNRIFIQTPEMKRIGCSISTFFEDSRDQFWIGTLDNGLVLMNHGQVHSYTENLPHPAIWGIGESPSGWIYVVLNNAAFARLIENKFKLLSRDAILDNQELRRAFQSRTINIRKYFLSPNKTISSGLICFDGDKIDSFTIEQGLPGHEITDVIQAADGRLWVATFNSGLAVLENNRFRPVNTRGSTGLSRIITLSATRDSALWALSQDEGVAFLKNDLLKTWGKNSNAITIPGNDIQPCRNQSALLSSETEFYYFINDAIHKIHNFPVIQNRHQISPFFHIDQQNKLWFTTTDHRLNSFQLHKIPPVIKINSCQIGDSLYRDPHLDSLLQCDYTQKACVIEYAGYHSSFPAHQVKYAYRLIQNNKPSNWSPFSSKKRLLYTQLEPGNHYCFEFKARSSDGQISSEPARLMISIAAKPLYLRAGFRWALALLILLCIALFFIYRYYKINQLIIRRRFNPYIAGEPIFKPELFRGRDQVMQKILSILHNNSIMISGERRIGKTSLLLQIKQHFLNSRDPKYTFIPVFIDLQGIGEWEFFQAMLSDIAEQALDGITGLNLRITRKQNDFSYRDFSADFRKIIRYLSAQHSNTVKVVLLIDEADAMNEYDQRVHAQLRRVFMQDFSTHFAAIIAGTNYIQNWNRPESPWWNLFTQVRLGAIKKADAIKLIQNPVKGIFKFKKDALETILEATQCKPYAIQTLCLDLINQSLDRHRRKIRKSDVLVLLNEVSDISH